MINYVYWFLIGATAIGLFMGLGVRFGIWKVGAAAAILVLAVGTFGYYFYLEQIFVKRYGGTMTISAADGTFHIGSTWKDDHLWVESWDPRTGECIFGEYSRSGMLEGSVVIKDCVPAQTLLPSLPQPPPPPPPPPPAP